MKQNLSQRGLILSSAPFVDGRERGCHIEVLSTSAHATEEHIVISYSARGVIGAMLYERARPGDLITLSATDRGFCRRVHAFSIDRAVSA